MRNQLLQRRHILQKLHRALWTLIAFGFSGAAAAFSQPAPPPLGKPHIIKLDWNTRALRSGDFNQDGLNDLALLNHDTARIEILLYDPHAQTSQIDSRRSVLRNRWEPVLQEAPFQHLSIGTGLLGFDLQIADFNGDKRPDIAFTSARHKLSLFLQDAEGQFTTTLHRDGFSPLPFTETLATADLNADGFTDLAALCEEGLLILMGSPDGLAPSMTFLPVTAPNPRNLQILDLDEDGKPDILYHALAPDRAIILHLSLPNPEISSPAPAFGPAIPVTHIEDAFSLTPLRQTTAQKSSPAFVWISGNSRSIETFSLQPKPRNSLPEDERWQPFIHATTSSHSPAGARLCAADFNSDGLPDIAAADSAAARLLLFLRQPDGSLAAPLDFPSLSGITDITALPTDTPQGSSLPSPPALVLISEKEKILGITRFQGAKLPFPTLLPLQGTPLALATLKHNPLTTPADNPGDPVTAPPKAFLAVLHAVENRYYISLRVAQTPAREIHSISLEDTRRAPSSLFPVDLDADGFDELIVTIPREPARIFALRESTTLTEIAIESSLRKGLLHDLNPNRLGYGDANEDGIQDLLVAADGFVRALHIDSSQQLAVLNQFNSRSPNATITAPILFTDPEAPAPNMRMAFHLPRDNALELLAPDERGVFRSIHTIPMPPIISLRAQLTLQPGSTNNPSFHTRITLFGQQRFWEFPLGGSLWQRQQLRPPYETDLRDVRPSLIRSARFPNSTNPSLLLLDGHQNFLEVLSPDQNQALQSTLHFTIFERNLHYGGRQGSPHEPREMLPVDLNSDGQDDIAFLIHDRILIYPVTQNP